MGRACARVLVCVCDFIHFCMMLFGINHLPKNNNGNCAPTSHVRSLAPPSSFPKPTARDRTQCVVGTPSPLLPQLLGPFLSTPSRSLETLRSSCAYVSDCWASSFQGRERKGSGAGGEGGMQGGVGEESMRRMCAYGCHLSAVSKG